MLTLCRWDMQRMRQEQQLQKLRARQEKQHAAQTKKFRRGMRQDKELDREVLVTALFYHYIVVLLATYVAARWLDVRVVKTVFNFNMATN